MPASPDRIAINVVKFVVVPAVLAAVGYFVIGPAVGSISAADKPADAKAQLDEIKQEAEKADAATEAAKTGKPVAAPDGQQEPDVQVTVDKDRQATAPTESDAHAGDAATTGDDSTPDSPDQATVPDTPPASATTRAVAPKTPGKTTPGKQKPKTPVKKPKERPAHDLPDTPAAGGSGTGTDTGDGG